MSAPTPSQLTLIGRSTSHFTRVARIFAAEAEIAHAYEVVPDLRLSETSAYSGNPALRIPILRAPEGTWFGALNICRALWRAGGREIHVIWPEELESPLLANTQELVLDAMSTEVTLLMSRLFGADNESAHAVKLRRSLTNMMDWLERHAEEALAQLPPRDLSYLEVALYCLVRHLPFREVMSVEPYPRLLEFCSSFELRQSAQDTAYRIDLAVSVRS